MTVSDQNIKPPENNFINFNYKTETYFLLPYLEIRY